MTTFTFSTIQLDKFKAYALPLLAPVTIAIVAAVLVWAFARASAVTAPDVDEGTRIMLQRRCSTEIRMMSTEIHHPYTGERVSLTRAHCAIPKLPEVINHD
jgi:hypothetical protein